MSSYRATADRPDQAKAIAAVVAVHALLAILILTGLKVTMARHVVDHLTTINIKELPPPRPLPTPKVSPKPKPAKQPSGPPARKAEPEPVVAPAAKLPPLPTIRAAKAKGSGDAVNSGAAANGTGSGATGSGTGAGGGGSADYSRFTPAQLVRNLGRGDYRSVTANRMPRGAAMVSLLVQPDGIPINCRIVRSSGDPIIDGALCNLIVARLRFRPALDDQGRPIPYQVQYVATWSL